MKYEKSPTSMQAVTKSKQSANHLLFMFISGSVLDNGHSYTSGRHASLMTSGSRGAIQEATQLREGLLTGTLTGQKVNYLDSGYSEEDADQQITSCLMKTSSGSIYIPPSKFESPKRKNRAKGLLLPTNEKCMFIS